MLDGPITWAGSAPAIAAVVLGVAGYLAALHARNSARKAKRKRLAKEAALKPAE